MDHGGVYWEERGSEGVCGKDDVGWGGRGLTLAEREAWGAGWVHGMSVGLQAACGHMWGAHGFKCNGLRKSVVKLRVQHPSPPVAILSPPSPQVVLVALPGVDLAAVSAEVDRQCNALPRNETARKALGHSYVVQVASRAEAIRFSNMYAPEHLIVNVEDAEDWLSELDNAGERGGACRRGLRARVGRRGRGGAGGESCERRGRFGTAIATCLWLCQHQRAVDRAGAGVASVMCAHIAGFCAVLLIH